MWWADGSASGDVEGGSKERMNGTILGIHHITAIADDPQRNVDFYTAVAAIKDPRRRSAH